MNELEPEQTQSNGAFASSRAVEPEPEPAKPEPGTTKPASELAKPTPKLAKPELDPAKLIPDPTKPRRYPAKFYPLKHSRRKAAKPKLPLPSYEPGDFELDPAKPLGYAWKLLFIVLLGLLAHGSTLSIVGASLKQISADLNTTESLLAWTLTGAFLAQAIGATTAGKLGDLYGHRKIYLVGCSLFVTGLFSSGLAWNAASLIGFRILSSLGGSMMIPTGMAMIMMAFPIYLRPRALGWFHAVATGGPALGLAVGGSLVDLLGWQAVFFLYGPFALAGGIFAYFTFRTTPRQENVSVDYVGSVLLAITATGMLVGIDRGANLGFDSGWAVTMLGVGFVGFVLFLSSQMKFHQLRSLLPSGNGGAGKQAQPLVPLKYFRLPSYTGAAATISLTNFVYMGGFVITPLLLQDHFKIQLTVVTLFLLIRPLSFSLSSPFGGLLAKKPGERFTAILGSSCMVVSMLAFASSPHLDQIWLVVIGLALSGACFGLVMPSLQLVITHTIPSKDLGVAMGVTQALASIAVASGIQTLFLVLGDGHSPDGVSTSDVKVAESTSEIYSPSDFSTAYLVGCAVAVVAVVAASVVRSTNASYSAAKPTGQLVN